jgi:hypothetical protein
LQPFLGFENDIHAVVSGVDTNITNRLDGKTLNNQVRTSVINLDITMLKLLMIGSYDFQPQPPSEDAATPEGLAEETKRNGGL